MFRARALGGAVVWGLDVEGMVVSRSTLLPACSDLVLA